ncbi:hypothetical protein [Rubrobacter calidifluminis]|uniref:hypothetical protein n=1 Tax=Rubrobacter calidifluminis TaxID=1392640 RepID=UPI0023619368|nr:hypothetical protein [Rubrobacter calidifluminis]
MGRDTGLPRPASEDAGREDVPREAACAGGRLGVGDLPEADVWEPFLPPRAGAGLFSPVLARASSSLKGSFGGP